MHVSQHTPILGRTILHFDEHLISRVLLAPRVRRERRRRSERESTLRVIASHSSASAYSSVLSDEYPGARVSRFSLLSSWIRAAVTILPQERSSHFRADRVVDGKMTRGPPATVVTGRSPLVLGASLRRRGKCQRGMAHRRARTAGRTDDDEESLRAARWQGASELSGVTKEHV